jgi:hypothetical protein
LAEDDAALLAHDRRAEGRQTESGGRLNQLSPLDHGEHLHEERRGPLAGRKKAVHIGRKEHKPARRRRRSLSCCNAGQASALCNSSVMNSATVRAACPHDCPDTCAMLVTVEDGRAVKVQGDPEHPTTHGSLCTKVSRYAERTHHSERVLHPMKRVGPKGSGQFVQVGWSEALADIASRLSAIAARERRGDRAVQLRRDDGAAAGREHLGALLPPARRVAARPHDLLVGRRRGARRRPTARRSACTSSTTPRAA